MKVGRIGFLHGYDPDNIELDRINTEIMLLQKFIFVTKRFIQLYDPDNITSKSQKNGPFN